MSKERTKQWRIVTDKDGRHVECPHCKSLDTIVEVDQAIRFNTLNLDGDEVTARMGSTGDWDFDHWFCTACMTDQLAAPDDFEIKEWYQ